MKRASLFLSLMLAIVFTGAAAAPVFASTPLPQPTGFVNDFAGVMSTFAKDHLEAELVQFNASTSNEIAVVTVNSLEGDYIENYAVQLFKLWGIGTEKNDNGVLLLLAIDDRELRIEVGYGLEGALPDSVAASIIADMTPFLKDGDYDGAITFGTKNIMMATAGEYVGSGTSSGMGMDIDTIFTIFIFVLVALQWVVAVLARSKSYWAGGVIGALAGGIISTFLGWWILGGLAFTVILFLVGLLLDLGVSSAYNEAKSSGIHPPWWAGGSSGSGSSAGGFGGFGGGSSGGGGASGSW